MAYWEQQNITQVSSTASEPYMAGHRQWLKSNEGERRDTVDRAYRAVRVQPTRDEINFWSDRVRGSGETCEEIKQRHQEFFRGQSRTPPIPIPKTRPDGAR